MIRDHQTRIAQASVSFFFSQPRPDMHVTFSSPYRTYAQWTPEEARHEQAIRAYLDEFSEMMNRMFCDRTGLHQPWHHGILQRFDAANLALRFHHRPLLDVLIRHDSPLYEDQAGEGWSLIDDFYIVATLKHWQFAAQNRTQESWATPSHRLLESFQLLEQAQISLVQYADSDDARDLMNACRSVLREASLQGSWRHVDEQVPPSLSLPCF